MLKEKKQTIFLLTSGLLIIVIVTTICGAVKPGLWIEDEFGYFGGPALVAGFEWKHLYTQLGYYGFGYGILLIPGFILCESTQQLMRYMSCINLLLLLGSYLFAVRIVFKLFPKKNKLLLYISIVIAILYINNNVQLHMGWSETINLFLYWWTLSVFYDVISNNKTHNYAILSFVLCFLIMVHMRNITVVIPCVLMLLIYKVRKHKINKKGAFIFCVGIILGAAIFFLLKKYVQYNLNGVSNNKQANDIISTISGLSLLKNIDWFYFLSKGAWAKMFYIFSATYLLIGFGIAGSIKICVKKRNGHSEQLKCVVGLALWIFISSFIVGVVNTAIPQRMDTMFYGRYFEPYIGMLLIIGFIGLNDHDDTIGKKLFLLFNILLIYKISFIITEKYYIKHLPGFKGYFTFICVVGIAKYFNIGVEKSEVLSVVFTSSLRCVCLYIALIGGVKFFENKIRHINYLTCIAVSSIIIVGQAGDAKLIVDWMRIYEEERYNNISPLLDIVNAEWTEREDCEVYYFITGTPYNPQADILAFQFGLGKTPIRVTDKMSDISLESGMKYIILNKKETNYASDKSVIENIGINLVHDTEIFELYIIN